MAAPPPDATSQLAQVTAIEPCGSDAVLLRVTPRKPFTPLNAGRFFMLRRADGVGPLIPRPFSLFKQEGDTIEFLIKVIGDGTRALAGCPIGADLTLIGPLGNGWPEVAPDPLTVMLAGGIGSAPFYQFIEERLASGVAPESLLMIYGAATAGFLYDLEAFEALGVRVLSTTDDGTHGFQGNVLQCLEAEWQAGRVPTQVQMLACGPEPMLRAVARLAEAKDLQAWLSLESYMGCGVGICNGCVVPTRKDGPNGSWPNVKCCVEGPVFAREAIEI